MCAGARALKGRRPAPSICPSRVVVGVTMLLFYSTKPRLISCLSLLGLEIEVVTSLTAHVCLLPQAGRHASMDGWRYLYFTVKNTTSEIKVFTFCFSRTRSLLFFFLLFSSPSCALLSAGCCVSFALRSVCFVFCSVCVLHAGLARVRGGPRKRGDLPGDAQNQALGADVVQPGVLRKYESINPQTPPLPVRRSTGAPVVFFTGKEPRRR